MRKHALAAPAAVIAAMLLVEPAAAQWTYAPSKTVTTIERGVRVTRGPGRLPVCYKRELEYALAGAPSAAPRPRTITVTIKRKGPRRPATRFEGRRPLTVHGITGVRRYYRGPGRFQNFGFGDGR
ncbi:MAG: hypothetical protein ACFB00_00155 [Parvularculaceae bacterium]